MKSSGSKKQGKAGQILPFPGNGGRAGRRLRFKRTLVSQFHFVQIAEFPDFHAIDPRTLRNQHKVSLCGLELPDPEYTSLLRHWHSDDQDPPDELICSQCRGLCHKSLQIPLEQKQGKVG